MAGNLSVSVTADTTQLRSQLALAEADLRNYTAAVRKAAEDIRSSGTATADQLVTLEKASAGWNAAKAAVSSLRQELTSATAATQTVTAATEAATVATHNHGAATEAMVLVHEAMSGRLNRMGSSLMILGQRLGGASTAMMGLFGAMGVAAMGAMHLVEWLERLNQAKLLAEAGALGSGIDQAQASQAVDTMRTLAGVTTEEAGKIVNAYSQMRGVTQPILAELISVTREFALRTGEDNTAAAHRIASAFGMEASAAMEVMEKTRASGDAVKAMQKALSDNDAIKVRQLLLQELAKSAQEVDTKTRAATEAEGHYREMQAGVAAAMASGPEAINPQAITGAMSQAANEEAAAATQRLAAALASVNNEMKALPAASWSAQVSTAAKEAGDKAMIAAHDAGQNRLQITEAATRAEMAVYQKAAQDETRSDAERSEAKRQAITLEMSLMREQSGAQEKAAKQSYEAQVAQFDAEIAAARGNVAQVQALEAQKLAFIRQAREATAADYQRALKSETEAVTAAVNEQVRAASQAGQRRLQEQKATLDLEVAQRQVTRTEALTEMLQAAQAERDTELASLNDLMQTLGQETAAYRAAYDARTRIVEQFSARTKELNAEIAASQARTSDQMAHAYVQAFAQVGSAMERATVGLISHTTTWQRAEAMVAQSMVSSFVSATGSMLARWGATQLAMTIAGKTANAARIQTDVATTGPLTALWNALSGQYATSEATKTAANAAGNASRVATDTAGAAAGATAHAAAAGKTVMSDAAQAFSGAYASASQIPYVGWILGPAAGAAAFAAVAGYEALASLDTGTWNVPQDMTANIHRGEIVVPAFEASLIRSGDATLGGGAGSGSGGGGDIHIYGPLVSAIDTQTGAQFLRANIKTIAQGLAVQLGRNPSLRPQY
jgi:hypothetical protein